MWESLTTDIVPRHRARQAAQERSFQIGHRSGKEHLSAVMRSPRFLVLLSDEMKDP